MWGGLTTDEFMDLPVEKRMELLREDERHRDNRKPENMVAAEESCKYLST